MEQIEQQLRVAISLLEGYASHDEKSGEVEDAHFVRSHVENMKLALTKNVSVTAQFGGSFSSKERNIGGQRS